MSGLRFHTEHTWVSWEGKIATIGLSDYAQNQLGKIIYVDLPDEGAELAQGEPFATVESSKVTSDVISPVSGTVTSVNFSLDDDPEKINQEPYGEGWIIKATLTKPKQLDELLDETDYLASVSKE
jgi:glycine cleavage system H protein